jgi:hypothetical protein
MGARHRILEAGAGAPWNQISGEADGWNNRRPRLPRPEEASEFQGKDEGEIAFIIKMPSKTPHRAMALCVTPTRPNATDRDYGLFRSAGQTQA